MTPNTQPLQVPHGGKNQHENPLALAGRGLVFPTPSTPWIRTLVGLSKANSGAYSQPVKMARPSFILHFFHVLYPESDISSLASVAHSLRLFSPLPRVILGLLLLLRGPSLRTAMAATGRPAAGGYQGHHSEFVQSFVTKRSQKKQRPKALSAAERAAHCKALSKIQNLQPASFEETEINVSGALRRWRAQVHQVAHFWVLLLTKHKDTANSTSFRDSGGT